MASRSFYTTDSQEIRLIEVRIAATSAPITGFSSRELLAALASQKSNFVKNDLLQVKMSKDSGILYISVISASDATC